MGGNDRVGGREWEGRREEGEWEGMIGWVGGNGRVGGRREEGGCEGMRG